MVSAVVCSVRLANLAHGRVGSVVLRHSASSVFGLVDRVSHQLAHMFALDPIEDLIPLAARGDKPRHPQLGEVLGDAGGRLPHGVGELVHRQLAVEQRVEQLDPRGV